MTNSAYENIRKVIYFLEDHVFAEKWAFGRWEDDGHLSSRESGGTFVKSSNLFDSRDEALGYIDDNFPEESWTYDLIRVFILYDYKEVFNP